MSEPMSVHVLAAVAGRGLLHNRLVLVLLLAAVAAGVAFQIPTAAHLAGYSEELVRAVIGREFGHVLISPEGLRPFDDADSTGRAVARLPFVRGVTVRMVHAGAVARQGEYQPVRIVGLDMQGEQPVTGFCTQVAEGACPAPGDVEAIVLGSQQAKELAAKVGDRMKLVMPYRDRGGVDIRLRMSNRDYRVAGILSGGGRWQADFDVYLPVASLRQLFNDDGLGNRIAVFVDERERAGQHAGKIRSVVGAARVQPWWEVHSFVHHAMIGNRRLALLSMFMVLIAVGIPVLALLYIHALHERRQVAILSSLGFERFDIFRIYLLKATIVGVAGTLVGLLIAVGLCLTLARWPIYDYEGFVVKPVLSAAIFLVPALAVCGTCVVAGILPAWLAARRSAAEVLRDA
jgi:ABC-type lipoprotein release transport system permease subunit